MKKIFFSLFLIGFLFTSISYSQTRTLVGSVTALDSIKVVNAKIKVLSSKLEVLTDSIGNFKVSCLPNDKIKISAKGFNTEKVKIDKTTTKLFIDLKFKLSEKNLDIAVGYGHIKEKDKSYAITNIRNTNKNEFSKYSNMLDLIVNSSPSITMSNGGIIIRGESSLNGSSAALIVIDGIDASMSQLTALLPLNIKSVDILKGGSAAMYGSRGANGVIIITTKRGGDL